MNKSMLAIGIILLSLIALLLINVLTNFSTGGELDYYLVRETTDASIQDSIDTTAYRDCKIIRLDRELFVEKFLYRFISSVDNTREYDVYFYDINEVPPKVSVKVDSATVLAFNVKSGESKEKADITTSYDAIVEANYDDDRLYESLHNDEHSNICNLYGSKVKGATK